MADPKLEEVFKQSGIPTYTFVKPVEYDKLIVSLRTPGRGVVIEGPSGIGKTTSVSKAIDELGLSRDALKLSARKGTDREIISHLPEMNDIGLVIIDDFHRLDDVSKNTIADFMKTLADEESTGSKIIIVGINKAGDSLVRFALDLNNRVDTIKFETNTKDRVLQLIQKGEDALNIKINNREDFAVDAQGSFHIAQILCKRLVS